MSVCVFGHAKDPEIPRITNPVKRVAGVCGKRWFRAGCGAANAESLSVSIYISQTLLCIIGSELVPVERFKEKVKTRKTETYWGQTPIGAPSLSGPVVRETGKPKPVALQHRNRWR